MKSEIITKKDEKEENQQEEINLETKISETNQETEDKEVKEQEEKKKTKKKKNKKKKTLKQKLFFCFKLLLVFVFLVIVAIYLFFKTDLFQKYKELWVQTAMSTMSHQYLATWFLSDEEIAEIMKKLEVENNENSDSENIVVEEPEEEKEITIERITGTGYVGFVMIVPDASKVKLVDGRMAR